MIAARGLLAAVALVAATPAWAAKKPLGPGERIDLNRAGVAELMRLPNVGRKKAQAIVALRARAPFRRVEDLLSVKGISIGWLDKQRSHLTLSPAAGPIKGVPPGRGR